MIDETLVKVLYGVEKCFSLMENGKEVDAILLLKEIMVYKEEFAYTKQGMVRAAISIERELDIKTKEEK